MVGKDHISAKDRMSCFFKENKQVFENIIYSFVTFIVVFLVFILLSGGLSE